MGQADWPFSLSRHVLGRPVSLVVATPQDLSFDQWVTAEGTGPHRARVDAVIVGVTPPTDRDSRRRPVSQRTGPHG